jgi:hypothetical protein
MPIASIWDGAAWVEIQAAAAAHTHSGTVLLGYAAVTANQVIASPPVDLTGLTTTVTVPAGHKIRITAGTQFSAVGADYYIALFIMEGATTLQTAQFCTGPLTNVETSMYAAVVLTAPSTGGHTYKLRMHRTSGAGNSTLVASATNPAFILVEDLGT